MDKPKQPKNAKTQVIGVRLPNELAIAIKQEAARRGMPMNALITELW